MTLASRALFFLVACGLAACAHSTEPGRFDALVTVQAPTLAASVDSGGSVTWLDFTVPVSIHNAGSESFTFEMCASRVEARSGDKWSTAWSPICFLGRSSPNDVLPGETRVFTVRVTAAIEGNGGPKWTAPGTDGAYRFVAGLITPAGRGPIPLVTSNEFTLSVGQ
jgi:hypothetical protein